MKKIISAFLLVAFLLIPLSAYAALETTPLSLGSRQSAVDDLTLRVNEVVKRVESSKPTGTAEEQRTQYQILNKEIDVLESEIDVLEDQYELDYLTSAISWEEYKALERTLDQLENKLDKAEDRLDLIFYKRN